MVTNLRYSHRILIFGGSKSGITNILLNLISQQPNIYKIYLYAMDPYGENTIC